MVRHDAPYGPAHVASVAPVPRDAVTLARVPDWPKRHRRNTDVIPTYYRNAISSNSSALTLIRP
jgi:hypothetical protein